MTGWRGGNSEITKGMRHRARGTAIAIHRANG